MDNVTSVQTSRRLFKEVAFDFAGAFADVAILFPILMLLSLKSNFSPVLLFGSAGVVYIVSGFIFRVPMSVQPLKALAAAAVTAGASTGEVRSAAIVVALCCLVAARSPLGSLLEKVPEVLVHGLQLGLGLLLLLQGLKLSTPALAIFVGLALVAITVRGHWPVMGWVALAGLVWGLFVRNAPMSLTILAATQAPEFRPWLVMSLAMPQVALTMANSVIATQNVSQRFFGERAKRVTHRRLLYSIGFGNLFTSLIGGLPFCHGSGGVTAHFKGGARTSLSNYIMGTFLCVVAALQVRNGFHGIDTPEWLLGGLLCATGLFHAGLAEKSFRSPERLSVIVVMGLVTMATRDLLMALLAGTCAYFFIEKMMTRARKDKNDCLPQRP
jgi:SulP family sulfate permease